MIFFNAKSCVEKNSQQSTDNSIVFIKTKKSNEFIAINLHI